MVRRVQGDDANRGRRSGKGDVGRHDAQVRRLRGRRYGDRNRTVDGGCRRVRGRHGVFAQRVQSQLEHVGAVVIGRECVTVGQRSVAVAAAEFDRAGVIGDRVVCGIERHDLQ